MSSDPDQRSTEPPDEPAPPTVRMPVQQAGQDTPAGPPSPGQAPPPGRMPPGGTPPGRVPSAGQEPSPGRWQEPATAPAPQWQPAPPAKPQAQPQFRPTVKEPALDPTLQAPAQDSAAPQQGRAAQDAMPPTQVQDPRQQPWQQPAPQWQRPQDPPPQQPQAAPQWTPTPPQAGGPWPPQPPQPGGQWGPPSQQPRQRRAPRRRRMRRSVMVTFTIVVIVILLVIVDRVANAVTENAFASQFQKQGVPVKPSVSIDGFPFLTQLAAKDFNQVDISASNIPVNLPTGGSLSITSVHATVNGLHISGYSSSANAKVDHITATAFVSFGSLAAAGSLGGTGVTLSQAGPNTVKITAGLAGIASDTEEAQILQTGPQTIEIKIVNSGSGLGSVLGSIGFNSFSFTLPKVVPASLRITALTLNSQGVTISAAASNATFSQS